MLTHPLRFERFALAAVLSLVSTLIVQPSRVSAQEDSGWIERSNQNAQILLETVAEVYPETATRLGIESADEDILDLSPGFRERNIAAFERTREALEQRLADVEPGPVELDLRILLNNAEQRLERFRLTNERLLPFFSVAEIAYGGIRSLLEDRISPERRQGALTRLKRYAGTEAGYEPLAEWAEAHLRQEWADGSRLPAFRGEVELALGASDRYVNEIGALFARYGLEGYEEDYQALTRQVEAYNDFVRSEILPETRTDFRLPRELYEFRLRDFGVDISSDELVRRARASFEEIQDQMQAVGSQIAEERGLLAGDYREVLRALKEDQLGREEILSFYERRMAEIERIIQQEGIVTLPERDVTIRLATEAESARTPAPFFSGPRLIGNTGERGEFVLPLRLTGGPSGSTMILDDFTFEAAAWGLAVHEARPGHELQFSRMIEEGVSHARAIFARNSVNTEGWALYMEEQMLPHLPLEGQFTILRGRLARAARAILDPGLHLGEITREQAEWMLREEVGSSEALTRGEIERYTFRNPGQAVTYFVGYLHLMELRAETELRLRDRFDEQAFHDFLLAQGFLPPALLREAVLEDFIPAQTP